MGLRLLTTTSALIARAAIYPTASSDDGTRPTITSVDPDDVNAGQASPQTVNLGTTLATPTVQGIVDGADVPTEYFSSLLVQVEISVLLMKYPGTHAIRIATADGQSGARLFTVLAETPTLTSATPSRRDVGQPPGAPVNFVLAGTKFYDDDTYTRVFVNGVETAYTWDSATQLTVPVSSIPARVLTFQVVNMGPNGSLPSAEVTAAINYPRPLSQSVSPTTAITGTGAKTITVAGSGGLFYDELAPGLLEDPGEESASVVTCDGVDLVTTWVNANTLEAIVPAGVVAAPGPKAIRVRNPTKAGGGGASTVAATFTVGFLAPTINAPTLAAPSPNPSSVTYTAGSTVIKIPGTNFYPGGASVIKKDGVAQTTRYNSPTELEFDWDPSVVEDVTITVENSGSGGGGGVSNAVTLSATPDVTAISPDNGFQYDPDGLPATVTTVGALTTTKVSLKGTGAPVEVPTTFLSSTQLGITIPGALSANLGNLTVRVRNGTGKPDSAASTTYAIEIINPLTDFTLPYNGSWDAYHVTFDYSLGMNDIVQADDIVNGTNPYRNSLSVPQNPRCGPDATLGNRPSVLFDGVNELLGTAVGLNPLVTRVVPAGNFVHFYAFKANTAANNNSTAATIFNNTQIWADDASPGTRAGLCILNNAGQMGVIFFLYDGAFKMTPRSTNCAFGLWTYVIVKKVGTTLSISVNGEPFLNTTGVGNVTATTQRTRLASAPAASGNHKLNGAWHVFMSWNGSDLDIMRAQNYGRFGLGIVYP